MLGEVSYQLGHAIKFRNVTPNFALGIIKNLPPLVGIVGS